MARARVWARTRLFWNCRAFVAAKRSGTRSERHSCRQDCRRSGEVRGIRDHCGRVYPDRDSLEAFTLRLGVPRQILNLVIGVDLPLLEVGFLQYLVLAAQGFQALVTVPRVAGYYEPLCAVYRKEFGALADEGLVANRNKVDALFSNVPLCVIPDETLAQHGFSLTMFRNANTPEDWKQIQKEFANRAARL